MKKAVLLCGEIEAYSNDSVMSALTNQGDL